VENTIKNINFLKKLKWNILITIETAQGVLKRTLDNNVSDKYIQRLAIADTQTTQRVRPPLLTTVHKRRYSPLTTNKREI